MIPSTLTCPGKWNASPSPTTTICGTSHITEMRRRRLLTSTAAESAMLVKLKTWPMPISCRGVRSLLPGVRRFQAGLRQRSMRTTPRAVERKEKMMMEPAEKVKEEVRRRSEARAWRTVRLSWTPIGVPRKMLEDHKGRILITDFRSSTCWTVHSFHGRATDPFGRMSPSTFTAARFSCLHDKLGQLTINAYFG